MIIQKNISRLFVQDILMSKLGRSRTTRILLPKAYYKFPEKKFPVMYLMDGQNLFDQNTAYFKPWNLQKVMDSLPLKDQVILVGIDNGGHYRGSEYMPHNHKRYHGEGELFLDFIINELKPKVDQHLRTLPSRENTIIVGSSLGGLISFYAATRHSDVFGKAGVMSPAFWIYPPIYNIEPKHFSKIYVMGSKSESRGMQATLEKTYWTFKKHNYPSENYRVVIKDRGRHSEVMWGQQFGNMVKWLMNHE